MQSRIVFWQAAWGASVITDSGHAVVDIGPTGSLNDGAHRCTRGATLSVSDAASFRISVQWHARSNHDPAVCWFRDQLVRLFSDG